MRKARSATDYFKRALSQQWPYAQESFQAAIAALSIIYYSKKELFPEAEIVLADDFFNLLARKAPGLEDQYQFIRKIDYCPAPHHRMILDYFRNGVVDLESYSGLLELTESNERLAYFNGECEQISSKFGAGFHTSHDDLITELHEFLKQNCKEIGVGKAYRVTDFLRQCGMEIGDDYVIMAIDSHLEREDVLDEFSLNFTTLPDRFRKELRSRYEVLGKRQMISPLMQKLAGSNGWSPDDIKLLREKTEEEWLDWISAYDAATETAENGEFYADVFHLVGTFLNRFASTPEDEDQETLMKIRSALEILRQRSEVDRLRVEMLESYMREHC